MIFKSSKFNLKSPNVDTDEFYTHVHFPSIDQQHVQAIYHYLTMKPGITIKFHDCPQCSGSSVLKAKTEICTMSSGICKTI